MSIRKLCVVLLVLLFAGFGSLAFAQTPVTPEIRVNVQPAHTSPFSLSVAMNAQGGFVALWPGPRAGSFSTFLYARRFAADGRPETGEILVSEDPVASYSLADAVLREDGSFLVVYHESPAGGGRFLESRLFAPDGTPLSEPVLIADLYTAGVTAELRADGGFVVAWSNHSSNRVLYRRLGPNGELLGPPRVLGPGYGPAIAVGPEGEMVMVWKKVPGGQAVVGQRFGADGRRLGPSFLVGRTSRRTLGSRSVAIAGDGSFLVAWSERSVDGTFGRFYTRNGTPLTRVRQLARPGDLVSRIAMDRQGELVLVTEDPRDGGTRDLLAQRFDELGSPLGEALFVGNNTDDFMLGQRVAGDGAGSFVVVWLSGDQILARVFRID